MELNLQEISQTAPKIFDCKVYDTILQSAIILFGRESVRNDDRRIVIKDRVNITLLLSWNEQKVYIYTYIGPLGKLQEPDSKDKLNIGNYVFRLFSLEDICNYLTIKRQENEFIKLNEG